MRREKLKVVPKEWPSLQRDSWELWQSAWPSLRYLECRYFKAKPVWHFLNVGRYMKLFISITPNLFSFYIYCWKSVPCATFPAQNSRNYFCAIKHFLSKLCQRRCQYSISYSLNLKYCALFTPVNHTLQAITIDVCSACFILKVHNALLWL